jgi:hypothetical protein
MLKRDEEACCRPRKKEGVRRGPYNAVRHQVEEKEEEKIITHEHNWGMLPTSLCVSYNITLGKSYTSTFN